MRRTTHYLCLGLAILCLAIPISSFAVNVFVIAVTVTGPDGTPLDELQVTATNLTKNLTATGKTGDSGPGTDGITLIGFSGSVADANDQIRITIEQTGKIVAKKMYTITQTDLDRSTAIIKIYLAPVITSIKPNTDKISGGASATLDGANFQKGATVTVGGTAATNVVFKSATQLTITTPKGTAGTADVVVTNPDGQAVILPGGFTYTHLAPVIRSITPNTDKISGGASVTLNGANFLNSATVTVGGTVATNVVFKSATQLTITIPKGTAGTADIVVTNPDGQSVTLPGGFTYTHLAPVIRSITPNTDKISGGASVTLNGANFLNGATVTVGGTAATNVVFKSATQLTITIPKGTAGTADIVVTNPDGQSVTFPGGFTYTHLAPVIRSITPNTDKISGGASATLNGANFLNGATVTVGGTVATNVVFKSATQLTIKIPKGTAGSADVVVTNPDGKSVTLPGGFTYTHLAPVIRSITPNTNTILGGASATLNGANFLNGATVTIGGTVATNVVFKSTTQLTIRIPKGTAGPADVVVTNPDGKSVTLPGSFTYTHLAPIITSITPNTDTILGGTSVTLNGANFLNGATVTFGGQDATDVVVSSTKISAKVPSGKVGTVGVTITNPDGQSATLPGSFTFTHLPPVVTSITPDNGTISGRASVTLNGENFQPGAIVTFGERDATDIIVLSSTEISAKAPPGEAGTVDVTVKNPDGQSVMVSFTYIAFPRWDVNQDGQVNILDLVVVAGQFGQRGRGLTGDINSDMNVNILDLVIVASHFGETTTLAAPSRLIAHRKMTGSTLTRTSLPSLNASLRMRMALTELERVVDTNPDARFAADLLREWLINTGEIPTKNKLLPNYPNPFNPETWIPYQLAQSTTVSISIYNISGQRVRELEVGHRHAGNYINRSEAVYWDGRNDFGERVTSGVYFYVLQAGNFAQTQKMIILK